MNKFLEYLNIFFFWFYTISTPLLCSFVLFKDNNGINQIISIVAIYYIAKISYYGAKKVFIEEPYNKLYDQSEDDS